MKRLRITPALALFMVAPVFGELFSGSTPLNEFINPFTALGLALLYGCGALIARELLVRWRKGWLSLLLLGFAYGIYEEGLVVRSFFDPNWVDLGSLGVYGRVDGVNWVWALHLTIFHAVISIMASVTFAEMLYPARRSESWVRGRKWWWAIWAGFLVWLPLGKALTPYDAPDDWVAVTWLAIFALVALARWLPSLDMTTRRKTPARPALFFLLAIGATLLHHIFIYMGADNNAYPFPAAMVLTALGDALALWVILRWRGRGDLWDDRHRMALILGVLGFFLLAPLIFDTGHPLLYFTNPIFFLALLMAYRRISRKRPPIPTEPAPSGA